jgi:hypothetical protein
LRSHRKEPIPDSHPQAFQNALPDAEVLMQEIISLTERWKQSAENWKRKISLKINYVFYKIVITGCNQKKNVDISNKT